MPSIMDLEPASTLDGSEWAPVAQTGQTRRTLVSSFGGVGATGDITGVTAGAGLTGGGTNGTVSLNVSFGSVAGTVASGADARLIGAMQTTGGTMTGALTLSGAPSAPLHAATKAYVDSTSGGGVGTITGVTAGTGLTGGGTSGTVTLTVSFGTVSGTAAQGNDSRIVNALPTTGGTMTGLLTLAATQAAGDNSLKAATTAYSDRVFSSTVPGAVPASGGGTVNYLRADGTFAAPAGGGSGTVGSATSGQLAYYSATGTAVSGLTLGTNLSITSGTLNAASGGSGTITGVTAGTGLTGGGTTGAVTLTVSYGTVSGTAAQGNDSRIVNALPTTGGTMSGTLTLAATQAAGDNSLKAATTAYSDRVFSSTAAGAVPASGGGTVNYLRADGTFAAPAGGGSGTVGSATSGQLAYYSATGTAVSGLTLGTNLSIIGGTLNAASGGSGTITGVTAGTGLTGGGTSGTVSLAVSYGTTSGTAAQGNDSRITGALQATTAATTYATIASPSFSGTVAGTADFSAITGIVSGATSSRSLATVFADRRSPKEWGAVMDGTTDDSVALFNATVALKDTNSLLFIPPGSRMLIGSAARLAGKTILFQGCGLIGSGARDNGAAGTGAYGARGGQVRFTDTGGSPFSVTSDWVFEGVQFFWPNQVENSSAPIVYPAMLTCASGVSCHSGRFCNNDVTNAYTVMDFTAAAAAGAFQIHQNRCFFLKAFLRLGVMQVESWLTNNDWSPYAYQNVALASGASFLKNYAATNGAVIDIVGAGTAIAATTLSVDGLLLDNNYTFGINTGIRVVGGMLDLSTINNCGWDGVQFVIAVGTGGLLSDVAINGGHWYLYKYNAPTTAVAAISVASDACGDLGGNKLHIHGVTAPSIAGSAIDWRSTNGQLTINNCHFPACNNIASGTYDAISLAYASAGNVKLSVRGCYVGFGAGGSRIGIIVGTGQPVLQIVGNVFYGATTPIYLSGTYTSIETTITGNISSATTGANAVDGPFGGYFVSAGNSFDKPVKGPSLDFSSTDGSLVFSFNGTPAVTFSTTGNLTATNLVTALDLNVAGSGAIAGAWTTTTGAVTATSGSLTTASASIRYKKIARIVIWSATITVTTNGTGAGALSVSMPFAAAVFQSVGYGREDAITGKSVSGVMAGTGSLMTVQYYDNTYPGANGMSIAMSGQYEAST